jgi:hypothetical protein
VSGDVHTVDMGLPSTSSSLVRTVLVLAVSLAAAPETETRARQGRPQPTIPALNEDTFSVQLIDDRERLLSIDKATIKNMAVETKSTMPAYAGKLTSDEMSDLIAYLLTLKGM